MQRDKDRGYTAGGGSGNDRAVVLFLLALGVLLPPGLWVWTGGGRPWWGLYAAWLAVIVATALLQGRSPR